MTNSICHAERICDAISTSTMLLQCIFNQLREMEHTNKLRAQHQKQGLVPKGMGFGLVDHVSTLNGMANQGQYAGAASSSAFKAAS